MVAAKVFLAVFCVALIAGQQGWALKFTDCGGSGAIGLTYKIDIEQCKDRSSDVCELDEKQKVVMNYEMYVGEGFKSARLTIKKEGQDKPVFARRISRCLPHEEIEMKNVFDATESGNMILEVVREEDQKMVACSKFVMKINSS